jgi:hypothetical protein
MGFRIKAQGSREPWDAIREPESNPEGGCATNVVTEEPGGGVHLKSADVQWAPSLEYGDDSTAASRSILVRHSLHSSTETFNGQMRDIM